jgi:hypothetical protein
MNVACKYYPDEGGGHTDSFDNGEVPNIGCEAHKMMPYKFITGSCTGRYINT